MDTVLGLFGLALFVVCVMTLAAAVTWAVVKVIPASRQENSERPAR
jgi:hypothetical protein